ncbi:flagella biosynthesis regulatory protein FliT [Pluralibacter gergoviae]|uniref:flagella biosynthesis regulatory protein FliT n=1 Tax=Pluralibacter gergoviae TaxID=61647 RepID=UPI003EE368A5
MESHLDLLQEYTQLLATSRKMLMLAEKGEWDELIRYETHYLLAVEAVTGGQHSLNIPASMHHQLRPILKQLLDNEVLIKKYLHQRMEALKALIGQTSVQHSLNTTYGQLAGNILYPREL